MDKEPNKQIELLQTEYAKEQFAKFEKERRQVVFRRRRLVAVFVAALVIFAIVGIQMFNDQMRLQKLQEYKAETVAKQEAADKKVTQLKRDVALLQDDEYVAKLARSKNEKIYPVLPDASDSKTETSGDEANASDTKTSDSE